MPVTTLDIVVAVTVALVGWVVCLNRLGMVWRKGRRTTDWRVVSSWLFMLMFALCVTFQVVPLSVALNGLAGVPNLSWLLAYVSLAVALYFAVSFACATAKIHDPRWLRPALVIVLAILAVIFGLGIATSPEWPNHNVPRSASDLVFMQTLYVYALATCLVFTLIFGRLVRDERTVPTRLRIATTVIAGSTASAFFLVKIVFAGLGYIHPSWPALPLLEHLYTVLMGLSGLVWALGFLPHRAYLTLARPFLFIDKVLALWDLREVQGRIDRLCPPLAPHTTPKGVLQRAWATWRNLDYHLYRTLIHILDGKQTLTASLRTVDDEKSQAASYLRLRVGLRDTSVLRNSDSTLEEGRWLQSILREVADGVEYLELVMAYRKVGRHLRNLKGIAE
jgi:hypothetical protein